MHQVYGVKNWIARWDLPGLVHILQKREDSPNSSELNGEPLVVEIGIHLEELVVLGSNARNQFVVRTNPKPNFFMEHAATKIMAPLEALLRVRFTIFVFQIINK